MTTNDDFDIAISIAAFDARLAGFGRRVDLNAELSDLPEHGVTDEMDTRIDESVKGRMARYSPPNCTLHIGSVERDRCVLRLHDASCPECWMDFVVARETLIDLLAEMDSRESDVTPA